MDVFGGAGTTTGPPGNWDTVPLRSTSIQLTGDEARARMANAPSRFSETQDDLDQATSMSAGYASNMAVAAE